ncbi:MAG: hypothetical protein ACRCTZ_15765 [Sarcina sp.]
MRQAIELLLKAGIASNVENKGELQEIFITNKHNVSTLYFKLKERLDIEHLTKNEKKWLESYLQSIEVVDANSDLFRYPFKDEFMNRYDEKALDIYHMSTRLLYCYSTLNKMTFGVCVEGVKLDANQTPEFIYITNERLGNCYLYDSPWDDGFHSQVIGYSEVAKFLFEKFKVVKDGKLFYPIVFLMRNAIEIALKRLLHMKMEKGTDYATIKNKKNSHLLKELWKAIKPMLLYYSKMDNQDEEVLELAEEYIKTINGIDKNGDMFRYPSSYSHEYKFNDENIDIENFYTYFLGIFNFLDACVSWLDYIKDFENEMLQDYYNEERTEYLAAMREYM